MKIIREIDHSKNTLLNEFRKHYQVECAISQAQKRKVFGIRYDIFCKEFGYEPIEHFPNELEYDKYDEYSINCLITHKKTGKAAGCVRMIPALSNNLEGLLPFEKYCSDSLNINLIQEWNLKRETTCEISRLAIDRILRKPSKMHLTYLYKSSIKIPQYHLECINVITIAAFLASTAITDITDRTNVFAMMDSSLPRLLKRSGICFKKVGTFINYHGLRAPHFIKTQSVLENMHPELVDFYQWIRNEIERSYNQ